MKLIERWLVNALALLLVAYVVPGVVVSGFYAALTAALMLGLINALIRPIILLLTLPVNVLTIGLFTLVINALMFWLASSMVKGFYVSGFWAAFWGALVMWVVSSLASSLFGADKNQP